MLKIHPEFKMWFQPPLLSQQDTLFTSQISLPYHVTVVNNQEKEQSRQIFPHLPPAAEAASTGCPGISAVSTCRPAAAVATSATTLAPSSNDGGRSPCSNGSNNKAVITDKPLRMQTKHAKNQCDSSIAISRRLCSSGKLQQSSEPICTQSKPAHCPQQ